MEIEPRHQHTRWIFYYWAILYSPSPKLWVSLLNNCVLRQVISQTGSKQVRQASWPGNSGKRPVSSFPVLITSMHHYACVFYFSVGPKDQTQALMFTWQVLHWLSYLSKSYIFMVYLLCVHRQRLGKISGVFLYYASTLLSERGSLLQTCSSVFHLCWLQVNLQVPDKFRSSCFLSKCS